MVTKLKSSRILRFIFIFIFSASLILALMGSKYILRNMDNINKKSFYETYEFTDILSQFNGNVMENFVDYKGGEGVKILREAEEEQVKQEAKESLKNYEAIVNSIEENYKEPIKRAKIEENSKEVEALINEKEERIQEAKKRNLQSEEDIRARIISGKTREYDRNLGNINSLPNIKYLIKDNENGRFESNIEEIKELSMEKLKEKSDFYLVLNGEDKKRVFDNADSTLNKEGIRRFYEYSNFKRISNENLQVSYFVFKDYFDEDRVQREKLNFDNFKNNYKNVLIAIGISIILAILALIYLRIYRRNWNGKKSVLEKIFNKLWIEMQGILILPLMIFILILSVELISKSFSNWDIGILLGVCIIAEYYILVFAYNSIIVPMREKGIKEVIVRKSILYKIFMISKETFIVRSIGFKIIGFLILTFIFIISLILINEAFIFLLYALAYMVFVIAYIIKFGGYLNKIIIGSSNIANGDLNYVIEEKGRGALKNLAHNINNIKSGLKEALVKEMKSERMKTELITNVSHDLKTPLTSIINYVNIIKNEDLSEEERKEYIEILDRKSQRLKILIEDLFEASKAASGEVELNIEKVDIVSLLKQALAEFDERIKASSLDFKIKLPEEKIYIMVDGKKTWRVLENQIINILKYSLENTRVYIDLEDFKDKVIITMKNISAFELDLNEEEILERFKRGDQSRNTEGSGLGLAISKSLTELQGGSFKINIDGDLFKVILEFPKAQL